MHVFHIFYLHLTLLGLCVSPDLKYGERQQKTELADLDVDEGVYNINNITICLQPIRIFIFVNNIQKAY